MAVSGPRMSNDCTLTVIQVMAGSFTLANNQDTPAPISGLIFNPAHVRSFSLSYTIYRQTTGSGAEELAESGIILGVYSSVSASWEITPFGVGDSQVRISVSNTTGQLNYTSSNMTGTPSMSKLTYTYTVMGD